MLNLSALQDMFQKIPGVDLIELFPMAWQKMTPEEKAEFLKNVLIIAAKAGAAA